MVRFFTQDTSFNIKDKLLLKKWIKNVIAAYNSVQGEISIIFCSDSYLLEINRKYLGHDYYTDIITFDYCEQNRISGDLFISVDTVRANAWKRSLGSSSRFSSRHLRRATRYRHMVDGEMPRRRLRRLLPFSQI